MRRAILVLVLLGLQLVLAGCTGLHSFSQAARAGDTVALAIGWSDRIGRHNATVHIIDSAGNETIYQPGDPSVRAFVNLYPDPVSRLLVGHATSQDLGVNAVANGIGAYSVIPGNTQDMFMTTAFLELPQPLAEGTARIYIESGTARIPAAPNQFIEVEILPGTGVSHPLEILESPGTDPSRLQSLERADYYRVKLAAGLPYSMQVELMHAPSSNGGGVGVPYVINPRGDRRNISWTDNGTELTVLITPVSASALNAGDFEFYVAGGISGLYVNELKAFREDGTEVPGVSMDVEHITF